MSEQRLREVLMAESDARLAWQEVKIRRWKKHREGENNDTAAWRLAALDTLDLQRAFEQARIERLAVQWVLGASPVDPFNVE